MTGREGALNPNLLIRRYLCGRPDPFRSVRDLGLVSPGCPARSGSSEGCCSSVWLPAWLPLPSPPRARLMVFKSIRGSPGRRRCDQHHWRSRLDRKARSSRIYPAYRLCLLNPRTLTPGEGNRLVSTRQISARCKTARRPLPREGIIAHHLLGSPGYRSMDFGALALVIAQRSTHYERVLRACHPGVAQDVGTPPPWSSSSSRTVQG